MYIVTESPSCQVRDQQRCVYSAAHIIEVYQQQISIKVYLLLFANFQTIPQSVTECIYCVFIFIDCWKNSAL